MSSISAQDYIAFTRIIRPAVKVKVRDSVGGVHDYESEPARIVAIGGSGIVRRVAKNTKSIDGDKYQTARVDCGGTLGVVTAIIDDATIIGVQQTVDLGIDELVETRKSIYGTDARGIA